MELIKRLFKKELSYWTVPLALLGLTVVVFGLTASKLGFYWDDWAKILVSKVWGLEGYWGYYAEDRPISAWTHILFTPLLGGNPVPWQIFVVVLRWLAACGLWGCLLGIFPKAKFSTTLSAVFFLVYPVFTQQPIAVTYHQQWLQYVLFFASLGAMITAVRRPQRWGIFTVLGLLCGLLQFSVTEYFLVVEGLRPFVLWILSGDGMEKKNFRQRLGFVLKQWLPYLILWGSFVVWRVFFMPQTGADPYRPQMMFRLLEQPFSTLVSLVKIIFVDSFYVLVTSWAPALNIGLTAVIPPSVSLAWYVGLAAAVLAAVYLFLLAGKNETVERKSWLLPMIGLGLVGVVLGCMPGWAIDRRVIDDFHSNRYAMPGMFGASMIWAAVVEWLSPRRLQKAALVGMLLALLVIFHIRTGDEYASIWDQQRDFYWQLAWRAPSLQPNTAILSEEELFSNQGGFSISAAINALYPQGGGKGTLSYWFYGLRPRFVDSASRPLGIPLKTAFRTESFVGVTPESILVFYDSQRANCLWVLSEKDKDDPDVPSLDKQFLPASSLERIGQTSTQGYPPQDMFGKEPGHGWCYFYQKAELAAQFGNWQEVAALGDKVRSGQEVDPADGRFKTPHEWLVFIEGYARQNRWQDAGDLAVRAANINLKKYSAQMCSLWKRVAADTPESQEKSNASQSVRESLKCP